MAQIQAPCHWDLIFDTIKAPKGLFSITAQLLNKQKTSEENICSYILGLSDVYKIDSFCPPDNKAILFPDL